MKKAAIERLNNKIGEITALFEIAPGPEIYKDALDLMEANLDFVRVCVKYCIYNVEATKRENEYLRKLVEEGK